MTLAERIADLIVREGPLPVARYMDLCLNDPADGYYATRPDLGAGGDFITAPLVSQMFGEILGLWAVETWTAMGCPARFLLVEAGPGLGVMMSDVLRAARVAPAFLGACAVWLWETSAPLRRRQAETLGALTTPQWANRLEDLPTGAPMILLANEFLDCLPVCQAVRTRSGWRERRIGLDAEGALVFVSGPPMSPPMAAGAPLRAVAEWSDAVADIGAAIARRLAADGGAALFVDYGRDRTDFGDTLQAVRLHRREGPLLSPGKADLTAHVDFPALLLAARGAGADVSPIIRQADFLERLGIRPRAAALARSRPDQGSVIARQLERLTAPDQMGSLFKVAAIVTPGLLVPGFTAP
jgi:NADH dehydrogenase [ubiquinone] 1 alpha subcomplex assembly factor 7